MISLKCEDCHGTMEIDESRMIISCPYCGSKKLITESDNVKIAKIMEEGRLKVTTVIEENNRQWWNDRGKEKEREVLSERIMVIILLLMLTCIIVFGLGYLMK